MNAMTELLDELAELVRQRIGHEFGIWKIQRREEELRLALLKAGYRPPTPAPVAEDV